MDYVICQHKNQIESARYSNITPVSPVSISLRDSSENINWGGGVVGGCF